MLPLNQKCAAMAPQVAQRIKELIPRDSNRQAQPHTIMAAAVGLMKLSHEESVKWALQYDGSVLNAWAVSLPGPLNQAQLMNLVLESAQAEAEEEMMERFADLIEEEQAMMTMPKDTRQKGDTTDLDTWFNRAGGEGTAEEEAADLAALEAEAAAEPRKAISAFVTTPAGKVRSSYVRMRVD